MSSGLQLNMDSLNMDMDMDNDNLYSCRNTKSEYNKQK